MKQSLESRDFEPQTGTSLNCPILLCDSVGSAIYCYPSVSISSLPTYSFLVLANTQPTLHFLLANSNMLTTPDADIAFMIMTSYSTPTDDFF